MTRCFLERDAVAVIAFEEVPRDEVMYYGVAAPVSAGDVFELADVVEKPSADEAPSNLAIAARYVLSPAVFDALEETQPGKGGEIQLTDALRALIRQGGKAYGVRLTGGERRYDIGNFDAYFQARFKPAFTVRAGKFKDKGRRFDIRVRLLAAQRQRPEDIQRLLVRSNGGALVRLGDLTRIEQRPSLQAITRKDRERAITIFGNPARGSSQSDAITSTVRIAEEVLPDGYRAITSGSSQAMAEAMWSLFFALILGLVVAYMVLATQFNAFTHPFTVLLALPFSMSGAIMALFLAGQSINVYSMLGLILLMGIAKKNSIMLVDFTNQIREQGTERHAALLRACPIRLRPILMTSVATIAGALPPAFAIGPGAEVQRPMALALVGGMLVSTVLTLFVVPAAYSALDDIVVWNKERRRRGEGLFAAIGALRRASSTGPAA